MIGITFAVTLVVTVSGHRRHRSLLTEGVRPGVSGVRHVIGDAEARRASRYAGAKWRDQLFFNAYGNHDDFDNLSPTELRRRLTRAASRYDFDVVSLMFRRPRQLAPKLVVRTRHYLALARATREILLRLDPKRNTGDDRTGWRFEGFYFEAQDERGVPFLITWNAVRDGHVVGGQWARSERLFPFPHG